MSFKRILSFSFLILAVNLLCTVNEDAGTTGFNNLKIIYSARAMSMSGAMTGINRNIEALQFNPAGILKLDELTLTSTFSSYVVGSNGGAIHLVYPRNENLAYGLSAHYLNMGQIDRTGVTSNNEYLDLGETFGAGNIIVGASIARAMSPAIDIGGTLKFVYDEIDTYSASAVLIDAGIMHHPVNEKIKVGLGIRNLGRQISYYTDGKFKENLPFTFAAGLSYQFSPKLLGAFDISKPTGANLTIKFGADYQIDETFSIRGGYNTNSSDWKTGGDFDWSSGMSLGAGFNWKKYRLDYGIASWGNLGFINQLSLNYSF